MPVTRLRMRPWLEQQIESKKISGLSWISKEEGIFQIPWKHAARHGWDINKDACLFRSWAVHTGKYKVGEKEPDPKTWKANFRCAMNSLPDIKEVRDKSVYKGSSAVRVYKMLPPQIKPDKKERKSKSLKDSKSRPKRKVESSSADEVEEAVKSCQLPDDHNSYTASVFSTQEIDIASSEEILDMNECEVSSSVIEFKDLIDMPMPDSTNDMYNLQVSPISSDVEEDEVTADELLKMLEPAVWQQTNIDGKGFFTNQSGHQNSFFQDSNYIYDAFKTDYEVRVTTEMKPAYEFNLHELTSAIMC